MASPSASYGRPQDILPSSAQFSHLLRSLPLPLRISALRLEGGLPGRLYQHSSLYKVSTCKSTSKKPPPIPCIPGILQITSTTLVAYILQTFPANFVLGTRYGTSSSLHARFISSHKLALSGISFWLNILSWFLNLAIVSGLIVTGVYARKGHRWAA